jgi:hypothetical protein
MFVVRDGLDRVYQDESLLTFEVQDAPDLRSGWFGEIAGVVRPRLKWTTELLSLAASDTNDRA